MATVLAMVVGGDNGVDYGRVWGRVVTGML